MQLHFGTAALARIDVNDVTFRISTDLSLAPIVESIRALGLIHPPILLEKPPGWIIVSGFRRVKSCMRLGWLETKSMIIPPDVSLNQCAKIAVTDNALQRPLNLIEMSRALTMIMDTDGGKLPESGDLPILGLPDNPEYLNKILTIGRLPESVRQGILNNHISLAVAMELGKLPADEAEIFASIFNRLPLSLNKQKEMITLVREIAYREDLELMDVLNHPHLQEILDDDVSDRVEKARRLRTCIQERRFPSLSKAKKILAEQIREIKLGDGISLKPPPNFESGTYRLEVSFSNRSELLQRKSAFDRAVDNQEIHQILDP